jgi:CRP/FNR family transcriptional regulator/CRP/FNR family cyclic AMP-dependent transcriptional regulator
MAEAALATLSSVPTFAGVSPETMQFLASHLRRRAFRRGETIVRQGEPAGALYVITAGTVKVTHITDEGDESVLGLVGRGGSIGEVTVFDGSPRSATVTAAEPVEVLALARDDLLAAIRADPDLAIALIATLASRLRAADARLEDAYFADLTTRLARRLLQIAEQHGRPSDTGIEVPLPLTQTELAAMLGAARSRVNGALGTLQDEGIIRLGRRSLVVLEPHALRRRAGR